MALDPNSPTTDLYATAVARSRSRTGTVPANPDGTAIGPGTGGAIQPVTPIVTRQPGTPLADQSTANLPGVQAGTGEWTMPGITDPSWGAVARGYQQRADTASQNAAQQRALLQQQYGIQRDRTQESGVYARRDISNDAEGRGILRSGEFQRNLAEQMNQEQQRLGDIAMNETSGLSGIDQGLASNIADLRGQFAEAQQRALQEQYSREAVAAAQQRAAEAAAQQQAQLEAERQAQAAQYNQWLAAQQAAAQAAANNIIITSPSSSVTPIFTSGFGNLGTANPTVNVNPASKTTTKVRGMS